MRDPASPKATLPNMITMMIGFQHVNLGDTNLPTIIPSLYQALRVMALVRLGFRVFVLVGMP